MHEQCRYFSWWTRTSLEQVCSTVEGIKKVAKPVEVYVAFRRMSSQSNRVSINYDTVGSTVPRNVSEVVSYLIISWKMHTMNMRE